MKESVCPHCHKSGEFGKYGEYVFCCHCGMEFFNVDPAVVVSAADNKKFFIVRMFAMGLMLLLVAAIVVFALINGAAYLMIAALLPFVGALACLREGGFRMVAGLLLGVILGSVVFFLLGLVTLGTAEDALMVVPLGLVSGIVLGFTFAGMLRGTSFVGERCPCCHHRGIRGGGEKNITCKHCGLRPYIEPEKRPFIAALAQRNCLKERMMSWAFGLLGLTILLALSIKSLQDMIILILFAGGACFLIAHAIKKTFSCKQCRTNWSMVTLNEETTVSDRLRLEQIPENLSAGKKEQLHFYYDQNTRITRACKCCGNINVSNIAGKKTAARFE